jgi:hypothetical protein
MRTGSIGFGLVLVCAAALSGCGDSRLPSWPSALLPLTTADGGGGRFSTRDDPPAAPLPGDPSEPLPADPFVDPAAPVTDPNVPAPLQVIVSIIGSFGFNAFMPNPIQANLGDMIVWTNSDVTLHHIVLDDGTDIGDVAPGQSTVPIPLTTPTAAFHCTLHPSMVGNINGDMTPPPPPPPDYYEPPPAYYY